MSLRIKLMLALFVTGLAAVAMVGGLTSYSVHSKFDTIRSRQAAQHFHHYMTAYLAEYGDWETAISTESFDRFVQRKEAAEAPPQGALPSEMLERMPPVIDEKSRQGEPDRARPPAYGVPGASGQPPHSAVPGQPRAGLRPPAPDGHRPAPPDGQPWLPQDGMRPPPQEGMRPPPQDGMRPPPRDGMRPPADGARPPPRDGMRPRPGDWPPEERPREGERAPQVQGALPPAQLYRAAYGAQAQSNDDPRRARDGTHFPPRPDGGDQRGRPLRGHEGRDGGPPPFRFVLADKHYTVLLGAGQYAPGAVLPEKARANARPIVVKGSTVAYVSTEGVMAPSKQEQEFLDAMQSSLLAGAAAAAILALGLGLLLAGGLSRRLSKLTGAVRAMQAGALRQQVVVAGRDEVAALAGAFNDMSAALARSHDELKASHQTILEQAEQLKELSIRDALTSLYNRRHFDEQANTLYHQAVRYQRPISLVIGDIDFFKKINDHFSHATGDLVLRHVGAILRQHVRLSDLVARYGGEEFVLALPDTDASQAAALCNKLRAMIEAHPWHDVHPNLKVTMSMGVYADRAAGTAEAMLQKADELLYKAKQTGRNRVCHA